MYNPFGGNRFPYTNFHELNLDWVIEIAKNFLDQYTSLQQTITDGMTSLEQTITDGTTGLEDKAAELEALLQEWYNTHSEDIAEELASAISSINQTLLNGIAAFNQSATAKGQEVIESIPDDYTALGNKVINLEWLANRNNSAFPSEFKVGTYTITNNELVFTADSSMICSNSSYASKKHVKAYSDAGYQFLTIQKLSGQWTMGSWTNYQIIAPNTEFYIMIKKLNDTGNILYKYNVNVSVCALETLFEAQTVFPVLIQSNNYETFLPDADNIKDNTCYIINYARYATDLPAHLPWSAFPYPSPCVLQSFAPQYSSTTNIGGYQKLFGIFGDEWIRTKTSQWSAWKCVKGATVTVGVDFGRIVDAINMANLIPNSTIYINAGYYDIITELNAVYPNFFSNYSVNNKHGRGLELGKGTKIIASPDATVMCYYQGSDDNVMANFSVFMALASDFEINGLTILCSKIKYAIHDDPLGDAEKAKRWRHVYKNCRIRIDNTNSTQNFKQCIGGGLGKQSVIEIENCSLESVGVSNNTAVVSYHNVVLDDAESIVTIKDCYFVTGTYRCSYYGPSTRVTRNLVSNNSLCAEPFITQETVDYNVVNMALLKWNNYIRP